MICTRHAEEHRFLCSWHRAHNKFQFLDWNLTQGRREGGTSWDKIGQDKADNSELNSKAPRREEIWRLQLTVPPSPRHFTLRIASLSAFRPLSVVSLFISLCVFIAACLNPHNCVCYVGEQNWDRISHCLWSQIPWAGRSCLSFAKSDCFEAVEPQPLFLSGLLCSVHLINWFRKRWMTRLGTSSSVKTVTPRLEHKFKYRCGELIRIHSTSAWIVFQYLWDMSPSDWISLFIQQWKLKSECWQCYTFGRLKLRAQAT